MKSVADVGFHSAGELLATYAGRASDLRPFVADAPVNDDLSLHLQYQAGLGLNARIAPQILSNILAYRKFPEDLITGTGEHMEVLRITLGRPHRTF